MASRIPIGQSYDPALEGEGMRSRSYRIAKSLMRLVAFLFMRRDWTGFEHIPSSGGAIIAINHVGEADPINSALFLDTAHRHPRFMAKSELFKVRGLKYLLEDTGQIPVYRATREAGEALSAAVKRLEAGGCVLVYPEGTITKDPQKWPMVARTGIARLVLATDAPVIPISQWGAHRIPKGWRPWKRVKVQMMGGPAIDLDRYRGKKLSPALLNEITEEIMSVLRQGVGELRGEPVPDHIWDNRLKTHVPFKSSQNNDDDRRTA